MDQIPVTQNTGHSPGQHCAGPLMAHLGLNVTCRASFAVYNNIAEVDVLIDALELAHEMFA